MEAEWAAKNVAEEAAEDKAEEDWQLTRNFQEFHKIFNPFQDATHISHTKFQTILTFQDF